MTPAATERRRASDVQAEATAHLEGRMDVMEERLAHLDEKIDGVDSKVDQANLVLKSIEKSIHRIELAGKDRDSEAALLKQQFENHAIGCPGKGELDQDSFGAFKKRVWDVLQIAIGIVGILALLVFAEHDLLSPQAAKMADKAIETAK